MSQTAKVLKHLKRYGTITPIQALERYGSFRLAARIYDLKLQGYDIETDLVGVRGVDQYAKYRLK